MKKVFLCFILSVGQFSAADTFDDVLAETKKCQYLNQNPEVPFVLSYSLSERGPKTTLKIHFGNKILKFMTPNLELKEIEFVFNERKNGNVNTYTKAYEDYQSDEPVQRTLSFLEISMWQDVDGEELSGESAKVRSDYRRFLRTIHNTLDDIEGFHKQFPFIETNYNFTQRNDTSTRHVIYNAFYCSLALLKSIEQT